MVKFSSLRLSGFKSFVEATELDIQDGVTGVVGPNGCGKSNLVEALKWVMGETSAKQVRGGEMDDVIFSGTTTRPARNLAEVVLTLDNSERTSPAQFNDTDDLVVSRRIEREKGSTYRVNSKEVRARDVQLLFADAATGARSTALVSQGQIGQVVAAKPAERRSLLEEAAGISGLHSRRHEAELRLRGAETNLERLDDVLVTLDAQMQGLKRQARQATRYRNLNDHIRKAEATLFLLRWDTASADKLAAESRLAGADKVVGDMSALAATASAAQAKAAADMPELRQAEAEAAAGLHRLTLARENLDDEEQRTGQAMREAEARIAQIASDIEREQTLAKDAGEAIHRLEEEEARITADSDGEADAVAEAGERLAEALAGANKAEVVLSELTERVADGEARRAEVERRRGEFEARAERLDRDIAEIGELRSELLSEAAGEGVLEAAAAAASQASDTLEAARQAAEEAETGRRDWGAKVGEAQATSQAAEAQQARMEAEAQALAELLETGDPDLWPPVIDAVEVTHGYELALGAALGDDLTAAADEAAPVHWREISASGGAPALPNGVPPLSDYVQGPAALLRRLTQIGVVDDDDQGARLHSQLHQGQRLVTTAGGLWRWDGYVAAAEAPGAAASRLEQRNRLAEVREGLAAARQAAKKAAAEAAKTRSRFAAADEAEKAARDALSNAETALGAARQAEAGLRQKAAEHSSRLAGLTDTGDRLAADLAETKKALTATDDAEKALSDADELRAEAEAARDAAAGQRATLLECQSAHDILNRQAESRSARRGVIADELAAWSERRSAAADQQEQLAERSEATAAERQRLAGRPEEIAKQRGELLDKVGEAEKKRSSAADRLAATESRLGDADRALREAETQLAQAREDRVRAEAAVEQAGQAMTALGERINDRLNCDADELREISGLKEDAEMPELEASEKRVDRLLRERENMGPVNLRAEQESRELAEQIETMETERADLISAIAKLRQGINQLNREGRQRLLTSFEEVDKHFQELFVRLFGGGRAHLTLTDSDDPLEAGLEIMASPPGKRLQVLSLLSGGEQALTALALLFAVFLTNPAPICVLDEVDAPLDDANVERFCSLVDEIAHSLSTRFLVITHHRITMARVDRLFGVTMGEQGVSQLVSVDLGRAEQIRAIA